MNFSWRVKGSGGFRILVCVYYRSGMWLQFSGFCLCEVNHSHPAGPHLLTTLWLPHTLTGAQARWSPYIMASCVFSQTNPHCFSLTWALAWPPTLPKKSERPVPGKRGRRERGVLRKEKLRARKSWPPFPQCRTLANPKPTKNEIGGEGRKGWRGRRRGLMKLTVDEGNL